MIDLIVNATDLLRDSTANRFNESLSQKLRDDLLPQVVLQLCNPSNIFNDVSHDEHRNPQVLVPVAKIPRDKKTLLRLAASPPS